MANVYLIGNAHLDPVWLWRWQDGYKEAHATFRSALDRMYDFPDYKFTSACAVYYQWIEKLDPEMFEEIKQRVKEGRWCITGGWFLQPDCNMPDGESFARHALISQRYFKEKFGVTAKTGYNVDSFGHNGSLPQILKKSGMDNYIFMRPQVHEKDIKENLFMWESDDGSQVCTYRIPWFYNFDMSDHKMSGREMKRFELIKELKQIADDTNTDQMAFYGVGNHGGGPTIKLIDEINKLNVPDTIYSTPNEYFENADRSVLPVVHDELQHHARGCYSTVTSIKKGNRECENNLILAEKMSVLAKEIAGVEYPHEELNKGWENVLFNQFHDILCGCSIKKAYEDAAYLHGETMSITEKIINFAMQSIALRIDTLQGETLPAYKSYVNWKLWEHEVLGTPVIVFNPYSWPVKMPVQVNAVAKKVTDENGVEIPFQKVRGDQTNGEDLYHTTFIAEVGAMGYAVYRAFIEKEGTAAFESDIVASENCLENSKIKVEFDKFTGDICSFYDKKSGRYIIDKPCKAILLDEEHCDTWAHDYETLGDVVGMFDAPEFEIIENGTIRATLRVTTKHGTSTLRRDYTISKDSNEIKVKTKANIDEKFRVLKFSFPISSDKIIAKTPYGTIKRDAIESEEFCGSWFASGNLCVANDSKYGYDAKDGEVRLTVLRTAIFADHFGQNTRDAFCEHMDMGITEFTYVISPYTDNASAEKTASLLNSPIRTLLDTFHKGTLPERMSYLECDKENIIVSAIKESEDGHDTIIRFYDMNGIDTDATIKLFGKEIKTKVSHNEIKTFTADGKELNLIEWEV